MKEIEDGIVYGAAAGLGFAATENLIYESNAFLTDGAEASSSPPFSAHLLRTSPRHRLFVHGSRIARSRLQGTSWIHTISELSSCTRCSNLAASLGPILEDDFGDSAYLFGLAAAFVIAIGGITIMRAKIRALEGRR